MDREERRLYIQNVSELRTLPSVVQNILKVANDPESSATDLVTAISNDQSISSMLLRLVNSAFYGNLRNVSSIQRAVVILGFQTVKTMALSVSVFKPPPGVKSVFNRKSFWLHSVGVAIAAQRLFEASPAKGGLEKDTVFLSGLLHDIGKVVFDNYFNEEYQAVILKAKNERRWVGDVEKEMLEMDHCEAGYYLAHKWQFPKTVVDAIRRHHGEIKESGDDGVVVAITHIADHLCRRIKLGSGGDTFEVPVNPAALDVSGVSSEDMYRIAAEMESEKEQVESMGFE